MTWQGHATASHLICGGGTYDEHRLLAKVEQWQALGYPLPNEWTVAPALVHKLTDQDMEPVLQVLIAMKDEVARANDNYPERLAYYATWIVADNPKIEWSLACRYGVAWIVIWLAMRDHGFFPVPDSPAWLEFIRPDPLFFEALYPDPESLGELLREAFREDRVDLTKVESPTDSDPAHRRAGGDDVAR